MATILNGDWIPKRTGGNRFNAEMSEIIRNSRRGQKFFFENIQAEAVFAEGYDNSFPGYFLQDNPAFYRLALPHNTTVDAGHSGIRVICIIMG